MYVSFLLADRTQDRQIFTTKQWVIKDHLQAIIFTQAHHTFLTAYFMYVIVRNLSLCGFFATYSLTTQNITMNKGDMNTHHT